MLEGDGLPVQDSVPDTDEVPADDDIPGLDDVVIRVRPLGLSILAVLAAIGCVVGIFVTVAATGGAGVVKGGALALVVVPVILVLSGALAYGLWELRWWAWPLALLTWISAGVQAVVSAFNGTFSTDLLVAPIVIAYLAQYDIRSLFGARVLTPSRRLVAVTVALALVTAALPVGTVAAAGWSPTVPADAGNTLLARIDTTALEGAAAGTADPADDETAFMGSDCLKRDQRPAGWLDLCWTVTRQPDEDPAGDYYRFEAGGTFASDATDEGQSDGSGVRWLVLRALLLTPVVDGYSFSNPNGELEGCPQSALGVSFSDRGYSLPCDGRTVGSAGLQDATVTWTCLGCLIPETPARAIGLSQEVKVAEGAKPAWSLFADFGH